LEQSLIGKKEFVRTKGGLHQFCSINIEIDEGHECGWDSEQNAIDEIHYRGRYKITWSPTRYPVEILAPPDLSEGYDGPISTFIGNQKITRHAKETIGPQ
jgi:hypothetical protein